MSGLHSNSDSKALPSSQGCGTAGSASLARLCGPAGALCLQVCLGSPCGCVLLCLTHRGLLNTAHGKKNYLRGAFCLTIAKSCPQADPASPAWDSLLPLSLPKAGPALLQGPCYCWGPFPISDWKCLPITRAMAAMLSSVCVVWPFHPSHHHLCDMLRTFWYFQAWQAWNCPDKGRWTGGLVWPSRPLEHSQPMGRAHLSLKSLLKL